MGLGRIGIIAILLFVSHTQKSFADIESCWSRLRSIGAHTRLRVSDFQDRIVDAALDSKVGQKIQRTAEFAEGLFQIQNPFPRYGERKVFELKHPDRELWRFVNRLKIADTEDVNKITRAEFKWIIEHHRLLGEFDFLDASQINRVYTRKPRHPRENISPEELQKPLTKEEITIAMAFRNMKEHKDFYLELIRSNPKLRITGLGWERSKNIGMKVALWIIIPTIVVSASGVINSLSHGAWVSLNAEALQASMRLKYYAETGRWPPRYSTAEIDEFRKASMAYQGSVDHLASDGLEAMMDRPTSFESTELTLYMARDIRRDPEHVFRLLHILYDKREAAKNFTDIRIGETTREYIDSIFKHFDPHGLVLKAFESGDYEFHPEYSYLVPPTSADTDHLNSYLIFQGGASGPE